MKRFVGLLFVSALGGALTLGVYKLFLQPKNLILEQAGAKPNLVQTNFPSALNATEAVDFREAAERTVNAVVHVKNMTISRGPSSLLDFFYGYGGGNPRAEIGTGSGVIISPDGYIVTNNHVIANSQELQVSLNNNKVYKAKLIGTDTNSDIALLKIEADEQLPYLAFGNSDNTQVGEWVLAVGNPFNLTSTVTAGIISAKARDLGNNQSFLQTDAAVNPGNSGGALVDTRGQLVGINTAITSQTGSYVGYSFAVPSNIARKVVEDIMEFGNVQEGILGVQGAELNSLNAEQLGIEDSEGFYVDSVEDESGAFKAGIRKGDVIKQIDNVKISKFADLSGFLRSKRPNDMVKVTVSRDGTLKTMNVKLAKNEIYRIESLGMAVRNLSEKDKKMFKTDSGVKISQLSQYLSRYGLQNKVIVELNDEKVSNVTDVKKIMENATEKRYVTLVMLNEKGERERLIIQ